MELIFLLIINILNAQKLLVIRPRILSTRFFRVLEKVGFEAHTANFEAFPAFGSEEVALFHVLRRRNQVTQQNTALAELPNILVIGEAPELNFDCDLLLAIGFVIAHHSLRLNLNIERRTLPLSETSHALAVYFDFVYAKRYVIILGHVFAHPIILTQIQPRILRLEIEVGVFLVAV